MFDKSAQGESCTHDAALVLFGLMFLFIGLKIWVDSSFSVLSWLKYHIQHTLMIIVTQIILYV